jgi:phosphonate transport system substrate-binding protein
MISPRETVHLYHDLPDYIAAKLGREIELVQRKTYGQINELFTTDQIDLAFICSGPYATGRDRYGFHALAVPQINGKHLYRSSLIVHKDSPYQAFSDLKGKSFAFTDPDSNTGRLVPAYWLSLQAETPENYFAKTIYTRLIELPPGRLNVSKARKIVQKLGKLDLAKLQFYFSSFKIDI